MWPTSLLYVAIPLANITRKLTGKFVSEQVSTEQCCCYKNHFHWMTSLSGVGLEWAVPKSTRPVFSYRHREEVTLLSSQHTNKRFMCQIYTFQVPWNRQRAWTVSWKSLRKFRSKGQFLKVILIFAVKITFCYNGTAGKVKWSAYIHIHQLETRCQHQLQKLWKFSY